MNELTYAGTHEGDVILMFPHAGHIFYFRKKDRRTLASFRVFTVESVEQKWDRSTPGDQLPNRVRQEIRNGGFEYQRGASTLSDAMV